MTARSEVTFPGHGFLSLIPSDCTQPFYFGGSEQTCCSNADYKPHYILDFIQYCFSTQLNPGQWSLRTRGRLCAEGKKIIIRLACEKWTRFFGMLFLINIWRVMVRVRDSHAVYLHFLLFQLYKHLSP